VGQFSPLDRASSVLLVTIFSMYWIEWLLKASSKSKIPENFAAARADLTACGDRVSEF
jgi:hypothetical protein